MPTYELRTPERVQDGRAGAGHLPMLPNTVRQFSCALNSAGLTPPWTAIGLPDDLQDALPLRQAQFLAGRYCAREALRALDPQLGGVSLPRTPSGAPLWPCGITGSITHTPGFAWAAVASTRDVAGVGIDAERIVSSAQAASIGPMVAWPVELASGRDAGLDRLQALTLVFSAKEAIFKCLFRFVGVRFGFHDVRIVSVDPVTEVFDARVVRTLSGAFSAGTLLHGRYDVEAELVRTAVLLAASQGPWSEAARSCA
jgi:enterobactin synthetase component D